MMSGVLYQSLENGDFHGTRRLRGLSVAMGVSLLTVVLLALVLVHRGYRSG